MHNIVVLVWSFPFRFCMPIPCSRTTLQSAYRRRCFLPVCIVSRCVFSSVSWSFYVRDAVYECPTIVLSVSLSVHRWISLPRHLPARLLLFLLHLQLNAHLRHLNVHVCAHKGPHACNTLALYCSENKLNVDVAVNG